MVKPSDLPGYTADATAQSVKKGQNNKSSAQIATCMGLPNLDKYWSAEYTSDTYTKGAVYVGSDATGYTSPQAITIDREMTANATKLTACFRLLVAGGGLPGGTTISSVTFNHMTGVPANVLGDIQVVATTTVGTTKVNLYIDDVLIVGTDLDEGVTFTGAGSPVPASVIQPLTATIANRVAGH